MKFKFEKLIIWQNSFEYGETINRLSSKFPKEEIFNLTSQMARAVDSSVFRLRTN